MATNPIPDKWTLAEYLDHEQAVGVKYEYIDGEIFAMSGGSKAHGRIISNTFIELGIQLRQTTCHAYTSDVRVKISDTKYVYPDISIVCGEDKFDDDDETMLTNPTLVVKVMSPSSENDDKGMKSDFYRSLPSAKGYLLLDQKRVFAQLYTPHESGWLLREFDQPDAIIPLDIIDCQLPLKEVYQHVQFD